MSERDGTDRINVSQAVPAETSVLAPQAHVPLHGPEVRMSEARPDRADRYAEPREPRARPVPERVDVDRERAIVVTVARLGARHTRLAAKGREGGRIRIPRERSRYSISDSLRVQPWRRPSNGHHLARATDSRMVPTSTIVEVRKSRTRCDSAIIMLFIPMALLSR